MAEPRTSGLIEIGTDAYAYVQAGGGLCVSNAGLIVGPESCIAIDALYAPSMTQAFRDEIKRVTDKPVSLLVNSHHHVDHTMGNALFPEAAIVSHVNSRSEQIRNGRRPLEQLMPLIPELTAEAETLDLRLPDVTFEGILTLHLGDREIVLQHLGRGHTIGDIIVLLPDEGLMYAGDLAFHEVTPVAFEGHIGDWLTVCYRINDRNPKTVVPGHGPVGDLKAFGKMSAYLATIRQQAKPFYDDGRSPKEATAGIDLGEFAAWEEPERLRLNVNKLFQEFEDEV